MIVDQLTKSTHFLVIRSTFSLERLVRLHINEMFKLHGVLVSIVLDWALRFTSQFCPKLQKKLGTILHFNTVFHLQIDGQSERTMTLEDMIQACVLKFKDSWVMHLSLVEFAYNYNCQANIGIAPYDALYWRKCRTPLC